MHILKNVHCAGCAYKKKQTCRTRKDSNDGNMCDPRQGMAYTKDET